MQGDFNQIGKQYEMLVTAAPPGHYQMLSAEAIQFFEDLQTHLRSKWLNDYQNSEYKRWSATLNCLQSFLYQMQRMAAHGQQLCKIMPSPEEMAGIAGTEALADFEALLYFGRSTLDRLTFAIAKQTYGQDCEKFDKLASILKNYEKKDKRAEYARKVINLSCSDFQGILINSKEGKTGLRSLLAHSRSTGESLTYIFVIHRLADGSILRFDLELEQIGVLNASWILNRMIPFVVLNLVASYSEFNKKLMLNVCKPTWQPQCVALSSFIDSTEKGTRFTTLRPNAFSTEIVTHHVKQELFAHVQKI